MAVTCREGGLEALMREILLAFWKVHILYHAAERPIYGQWIINELRRHGYDISPGTLYPLLHRMEAQGWLEPAGAPSEAAGVRQDYVLTGRGREALALIRERIEEMYREVILEEQGGGES
jgi:DNA-binding PadR family transcriptional regulator